LKPPCALRLRDAVHHFLSMLVGLPKAVGRPGWWEDTSSLWRRRRGNFCEVVRSVCSIHIACQAGDCDKEKTVETQGQSQLL
jgi:hypothetical protein